MPKFIIILLINLFLSSPLSAAKYSAPIKEVCTDLNTIITCKKSPSSNNKVRCRCEPFNATSCSREGQYQTCGKRGCSCLPISSCPNKPRQSDTFPHCTKVSKKKQKTNCKCTKKDPIPLKIQRQSNMAFGNFTTPKSGGTLTINARTGRLSTTGGVPTVGSDYRRAEFDLTGEAEAKYTITLPTEVEFIGLGGGDADKLTLDNFTVHPGISGTLSSKGQATIFVGGTLKVSSKLHSTGSVEAKFSIRAQENN